MQPITVYWEYAFLENCLLDGLLLYLALCAARVRVYPLNLVSGALLGGAIGVVFPLIPLPVWAAYPVKIASGALVSLLAVRRGGAKAHFIACGVFFALTFALGGLLVAAYSFFGAEYLAGGGYLVEAAPVGLVIGLAGIFAVATVAASKWLYRYRRLKRNIIDCTLTAARTLRLMGLADSGNLLYFAGKPVSVVSPIAALALFSGRKEAGRITLSTVTGSKEAPVFECDIEFKLGKATQTVKNAYVTVGEVQGKNYDFILHTATLGVENETVAPLKKMAERHNAKRERS